MGKHRRREERTRTKKTGKGREIRKGRKEEAPRRLRQRLETVVGQVERIEPRQDRREVAGELVDGVVGEIEHAQSLERTELGRADRAQLVAGEDQLFDVGELRNVDAALREAVDRRVAQRQPTRSFAVRGRRGRPAPQLLVVVQDYLVVVASCEKLGVAQLVVGQHQATQVESLEQMSVGRVIQPAHDDALTSLAITASTCALCANATSSVEPEVRDVSQRRWNPSNRSRSMLSGHVLLVRQQEH